MNFKKALGTRIKNLREAKGLTQEVLSELSGVSTNFISATERGASIPSIKTCAKIANGLGVTLSDLLAVDLPPPKATAKDTMIERISNRLRAAGDRNIVHVQRVVEALLRSLDSD